MDFLADDEIETAHQGIWSILIVDDEPEMHHVTTMALRDYSFQQRKLSFISAHSAAEAKSILQQQNDIALILLDVVMETDDAGLKLVRYIRDELNNHLVRIILRTGQPGQAPEQKVVQEYDINDYRSKTELTVQRLTTTITSALRAYLAISQLEQLNQTLEAKVAARTRQLEAANAKLKQSLAELEAGEKAGKQVQFKLLPPAHWDWHAFRFEHQLHPSDYMSGDFVDYFAIDDKHCGFYIADVSGHGVASAFVTVYLKRFISSQLARFRQQQSRLILEPAALLNALNKELLKEGIGKYIALFYGVLDRANQQLTFANAGAFPWPLLQPQDQAAHWLELKSTPAGMFDAVKYQDSQIDFTPGTAMQLCSDGLLDLLPGETTEQKLDLLQQHGVTELAQLFTDFKIDVSQSLPDDLTVLRVHCPGDANER
ncbi:SpoIIE family protein phosphatase [Alkalimonas sp.]|uniref:PP2C family protein-serine/threonine phosphatase n=1 Tax=Alkalimonas sp. TaxID=1872453 RepID=UPI00263BBAF2|nr:SpoIIE family protein phosphatase [Alkalimonas sp.]MCC5827205.1 SpoIIE family protein phosphatase [Alkalimonas sp.]